MKKRLRPKWLIWILLAALIFADAALLLFAPLTPISPNQLLLPTAEYLLQNPALKPDFLSIQYEDLGCSGVGVSINEKPFAEYGLPEKELSDHISKNFTLTLDGIQAQSSPYAFRYSNLMLNCDGASPNLKCWSWVQMCYVKAGLNAGLHLAEFAFTDMSGKQYSYQWAFFTSTSATPTP